MDTQKARAKLEALVWTKKHRDHRGVRSDGTKVISVWVPGRGTCSAPVSSLTTQELLENLPKRVKETDRFLKIAPFL